MTRFGVALAGLRSSLWFVPSVIVALHVGLAIALVEVDTGLDQDVLDRFPRLFGAGAEGTRGMLSAIASATVTVTGVVFSVTIVALSLTSSQYSSRVLRNFMRDRTSQVVLGAFLGTYAYCLIVLRTIRGGDAHPFVPSLATLGAIVLAFVGIGLLIHFIHHISSSIQAARILSAIHEETCQTIERVLSDRSTGDDAEDEPRPAARESLPSHTVAASQTGYVADVDVERLLSVACKQHLVLQLPHCVGDFVYAGCPLLRIGGEGSIDGGTIESLRDAIPLRPQRTMEQDVGFGIRQIVDIALKALSPGINDPTTATMCIDYLTAILVTLGDRAFPSGLRWEGGELRLVRAVPTFASILSQAVEEIALAAHDHPIVLRNMIDCLHAVASATPSSGRRRCTVRALLRLAGSADRVADERWRAEIIRMIEQTAAKLGREGSLDDARGEDVASRSSM
jgi:uncharacterized membrane protein